jgi:hypothetical protein
MLILPSIDSSCILRDLAPPKILFYAITHWLRHWAGLDKEKQIRSLAANRNTVYLVTISSSIQTGLPLRDQEIVSFCREVHIQL